MGKKRGKEEGRGGKEDRGKRRRKSVYLMMTGRNTFLQNHPKQLLDGPAGAGEKAISIILLPAPVPSKLTLHHLWGSEIV